MIAFTNPIEVPLGAVTCESFSVALTVGRVSGGRRIRSLPDRSISGAESDIALERGNSNCKSASMVSGAALGKSANGTPPPRIDANKR